MAKAKKKKVEEKVEEQAAEQEEEQVEEAQAEEEQAEEVVQGDPVVETEAPLFQKRLGATLKGMPRFVKADEKTGMKLFEIYPGPLGITVRLYDEDAGSIDRYVTYDGLAELARNS